MCPGSTSEETETGKLTRPSERINLIGWTLETRSPWDPHCEFELAKSWPATYRTYTDTCAAAAGRDRVSRSIYRRGTSNATNLLRMRHPELRISRAWHMAALLLALTPATELRGQDVVGDLSRLAVENAGLYIEPLTHGWAFALSGNLFDGARPLGRFGFDLGVRVTGAVPPASAESFVPVLPTSIQWQGSTYSDIPPYRVRGGGAGATPTAVGQGPGVVLEPNGEFEEALIAAQEEPGDFEIPFPEGRDIPVVPIPLLHLSLGVGFGTDISVRFVPEVDVDDEIGGVSARGFGVRHSVTQWVPGTLPLDVSAFVGAQSLRVGEYVDASSVQVGILAGRDMGPLSVYGSGLLRNGSFDVTYTARNSEGNPALPDDAMTVDFTTDIPTGVALGLGAQLSLLFMNISGQYTFDDYSLISLKVGFGRR